jgi:SpoVK/Ycf46/Vps4 family AAA+-type ATPase
VSTSEPKATLTLKLDNSDFDVALDNSVPLVLRGVELYHGSTCSWDDIGGLSEVKKILIEVLQWPSQVSILLKSVVFCDILLLCSQD